MPLDAVDSRAFDLASLRVASPCSARWDEMQGDDRVRHCAQCSLDVYDASYLTEAELRALVSAKVSGQRLCMRLHRRADGTVLTRDCPVGARRRRVRMLAAVAAGLSALAVGVRWTYERVTGAEPVVSLKPPAPPERHPHLMGDVAVAPMGRIAVAPPPAAPPPAAGSAGGAESGATGTGSDAPNAR